MKKIEINDSLIQAVLCLSILAIAIPLAVLFQPSWFIFGVILMLEAIAVSATKISQRLTTKHIL